MATYYVKNGGNNAASGLSDALAWETFAYAASKTYSAGDSILFKRGDTFAISYNTTWTLSGTGSEGNVITVGAYDSGAKPILTQLETTSGSWTYYGSGNIWYKSIAGYVKRCWWDGAESGKATSIGGISASPCRWFFNDANDTLYLYDGSATDDPNVVYTTITINRGQTIFSATDVDYWTFDNLEITGSCTQFYLGGSADHLTIQNCNLYDLGIDPDGSYTIYSSFYGSANNDYLSFLDNDVDNHLNLISQDLPAETNMVVGDCINMESNSNHWLIRGNTFNDCGHVTVQINGWVTTEGRTANDNIIEYNTFLNDGSPYNCPFQFTGRTGKCMRTIFRYNYLEHHNLGAAIAGEDTECYYNIFYHADHNPVMNWSTPGLTLFTTNAIYVCNGAKVYNNLMKDCTGEGLVLLYFAAVGPFNALIKNNIIVNCGNGPSNWGLSIGTAIFIETGVSTTNVIDKNCVYNASYANTIWYQTSESHTLAWADAYTTEFVSNLATDPLVGADFKIAAGSPCINAGVDVGLTEDYAGNLIVGLPDIGAYEYPGGAVTAVTIFFGCNF